MPPTTHDILTLALLLLATPISAVTAAKEDGTLKICTSQNKGADCYTETPEYGKCTTIKDPARYGDKGSTFLMTGPTTDKSKFWCRLFENKECKDFDPEGKIAPGYNSVWTRILDPGILEWNSAWVYSAYRCRYEGRH